MEYEIFGLIVENTKIFEDELFSNHASTVS
jgi:hypothetical protein